MKIEVGLSPLGPVLVDMPENCELHRQLRQLFDRPIWLHQGPPGMARSMAHGQSTAGMPIAEMRRLTGAVGE